MSLRGCGGRSIRCRAGRCCSDILGVVQGLSGKRRSGFVFFFAKTDPCKWLGLGFYLFFSPPFSFLFFSSSSRQAVGNGCLAERALCFASLVIIFRIQPAPKADILGMGIPCSAAASQPSLPVYRAGRESRALQSSAPPQRVEFKPLQHVIFMLCRDFYKRIEILLRCIIGKETLFPLK